MSTLFRRLIFYELWLLTHELYQLLEGANMDSKPFTQNPWLGKMVKTVSWLFRNSECVLILLFCATVTLETLVLLPCTFRDKIILYRHLPFLNNWHLAPQTFPLYQYLIRYFQNLINIWLTSFLVHHYVIIINFICLLTWILRSPPIKIYIMYLIL